MWTPVRLSILILFIFSAANVGFADEDAKSKAVAKNVATDIERQIDEMTQRGNERKMYYHKKIQESLENSAKEISMPGWRRQWMLENEARDQQEYAKIDAISEQKIKDGKKQILDLPEDVWRKEYISATEDAKGGVILFYETILDGLVQDGYITTTESADRKSRAAREWPEARAAYGR